MDCLSHLLLLEDILINIALFSSWQGQGFGILLYRVDSSCSYESVRADVRDETNLPPLFHAFRGGSFLSLVITSLPVH